MPACRPSPTQLRPALTVYLRVCHCPPAQPAKRGWLAVYMCWLVWLHDCATRPCGTVERHVHSQLACQTIISGSDRKPGRQPASWPGRPAGQLAGWLAEWLALSVCLPACLAVQPVSQSTLCLFVCLCVCLFVCLPRDLIF